VSIDKVATTRSDLIKLDSEVIESIIYERIRIFLSARNHNNAQNKNKFKCSIIKNNSEVVTHIIDNPIFEWYPKNTGEYKFSVQSIDRDLNYSSPKVLTISILNPWYLRLNYLFPFLGFISLILYTTYSSTTRYLKQKQFNEKLRLEAQRKDKEAREVLEDKNKDLIESQKAAEAANEAKSTFLANMSHELRTPLNAIIGYSEMLIEDAEDENDDFIPDLDKINNSGKHLLGLINDILDLSKVESGKMELYLEEFDLQNTMSEIEATITPLVEKNSNIFKLEYETDVEKMKADVTKVRQILLNLLSNSSKFTKDGVIKVHVKDSDNIKQGVDFIIEDTGIGMSSDQVEKVFQPFTQADEKTTRKFGGTGLGLTITKMFAEMMGGMIDVSSVESEGTTFTVTLPRVVNDDSSTVQHTASERSDDKDYTVLVIDDDDSAQDMMKRFLEKQGYNVIQAKTGEMGLKLATEHMPDLITLDVMMPEMDGWEVLNTLQSNERSKKIPVIMLSMANEPDIGYSLGATDYLTKPVDWNELSTILLKHQIESDSQTVLIVEDDETTRQMLRKSLETNDYKVRSASNGKEGLEKVKQFKPGLILLDLMMPEMDGFEFAERLREKKEWLDIPVVVITAKDLSKEDLSRLKGNVETIMQKGSYSKDELLSEVGDRIKKLKGDRTS
jgi:signal transduction histidine kinase/DNA-binding response OmpR family regulator